MPRSLTDIERKQAARALLKEGVIPSRENIAERAAVGGDEEQPTGGAAARDLVRGGPSSEIARRKQEEMDRARRQGPPADVLRKFRERNAR